MNKLKVMLEGLGDAAVGVGFFPSAKYEDGTPVAYVATIQEMGAPAQGIPPRSFMRSTAEAEKGEWASTARKGGAAIVKGSATAEQVLETIGLVAAGDIRQTISKITTPELKPSTIANRLRKRANKTTLGKLDKPLVDTATLLNSVTSEVIKK